MASDEPFSEKLRVPEALTFDDVLLRPKESRVEPDDADMTTRVSKNVTLSLPVLSAAMDTVTEAELAIEMSRQGGLGVLHRNMSVEAMVEQVEQIKRADELIIRDVVTASPDQTVREVDKMMERKGVSGAPVIDEDDTVIIADPMLATGSTIVAVLEEVFEVGDPERLVVLSAVSAPPGLVRVGDAFPSADILTVSIDERLDEDGYIVPGVGDAGDRAFGT
jgi:uracil phosphoribosyltransferase